MVGWCFAFGLLMVSLYWVAASMFVDLAHFWWAIPFAVAGLPAMFALYYGLFTLLARWWGVMRLDGIIMLALCWFLADYARAHMFSGFPWDMLGYVWGGSLPILQVTSVIGIEGLTVVTLLIVLLPAALVVPVITRQTRRIFAFSLIVLLALWGWGNWRLEHASAAMVPQVRLRLVQTDLSQSHKWVSEEREAHFQELLNLSFAPGAQPVTDVIWPETATAFFLTEDFQRRQAIAARMPVGTHVITGVVERAQEPNGHMLYHNSLIAMDAQTNIIAGYDKSHLVPFGEYIPYSRYLPVRALVIGDFEAGEGAVGLRVPHLPPFSPLICYEAIFSGQVTDSNDRPQWLLNVSNDAWYEGTMGPYQHFAIARVRAIEEGMPLVRVANKGVVGVVDAYGRIKAELGWGKAAFIDSDLPAALPPTWFAQQRGLGLWLLVGLTFLGAGILRFRHRN